MKWISLFGNFFYRNEGHILLLVVELAKTLCEQFFVRAPRREWTQPVGILLLDPRPVFSPEERLDVCVWHYGNETFGFILIVGGYCDVKQLVLLGAGESEARLERADGLETCGRLNLAFYFFHAEIFHRLWSCTRFAGQNKIISGPKVDRLWFWRICFSSA